MKGNKFIYLFVAFLLPGLIFVFLKFFGRNQFAVEPLYVNEAPETAAACGQVTLPYLVPDSVIRSLAFGSDSLLLVTFGDPSVEAKRQRRRVEEEMDGQAPREVAISPTAPHYQPWRACIFFLDEPFDMVLVDNHGVIRGQYTAADREEIDRLLTELTIILKQY